jgi:hypothetical protein
LDGPDEELSAKFSAGVSPSAQFRWVRCRLCSSFQGTAYLYPFPKNSLTDLTFQTVNLVSGPKDPFPSSPDAGTGARCPICGYRLFVSHFLVRTLRECTFIAQCVRIRCGPFGIITVCPKTENYRHGSFVSFRQPARLDVRNANSVQHPENQFWTCLSGEPPLHHALTVCRRAGSIRSIVLPSIELSRSS